MKYINLISLTPRPRSILVLAAGLLISCMASATPESEDKEQYVEPKDMEVVEVRGKVNKNGAFFKRQIQLTEIDFYKSFNSVSDVKKFKIKCRKEASINSRIKKTVCYPQYALDRLALETQRARRQNIPTPTMKEIEDLTLREREESFAYMEEVIKKDPELAKLFIEMRKAQLNYDEWKSQ